MEEEDDFEPPSKRKILSRPPEEDDEEEPRPARKGGRRPVAGEEEEEEERPARKKSKKSKKSQNNAVLMWSLIIGGAVVLLGGSITLFFVLKGSSPDTDKQAANKDGKAPQKDSSRDKTGQPDDKLPKWQPDAALLKQLGKEVAVHGYRIQPPNGHTLQDRAIGGGHVLNWLGPARANGSAPNLVLGIFPLPANERNMPLESGFKNYVAGFKNSQKNTLANLDNSPAEKGQINGIVFLRSRLTGASTTGVKVQGFTYVAQDGPNLITLTSLDRGPDDKTSIPLMEAAARTFKK
jgi:hypothetical protein